IGFQSTGRDERLARPLSCASDRGRSGGSSLPRSHCAATTSGPEALQRFDVTLSRRGCRICYRWFRRREIQLADGGKNLCPRTEGSHHGAGDLGFARDAATVRDGNLHNAQSMFDRLDLHLNRPAPRRVNHLESFERIATDHTQRAKVGVAMTPEQTNQETSEPVAEALLWREIVARSAEHASAENEVGLAGTDGRDQFCHFIRRIASIGVEETDHINVVAQGGDARETRLSIPASQFAYHVRSCQARAFRRRVRTSVVHDDNLLCEAIRDGLQDARNAVLFVTRRN